MFLPFKSLESSTGFIHFFTGNLPISNENLHLESARHDYFALIDDHFELRRNLDELRKVWQLSTIEKQDVLKSMTQNDFQTGVECWKQL